jgi:hypothetical protein
LVLLKRDDQVLLDHVRRGQVSILWMAGRIRLTDAPPPANDGAAELPTRLAPLDIADWWRTAPDTDRVEAVRVIGVADVWDAMTPNI